MLRFLHSYRIGLRHEKIVTAGGFDPEYYRAQIHGPAPRRLSSVRHFCRSGWRQGLNPTPWFSCSEYLALNPDVAKAGLNPFVHYLEHGRDEGRLTASAEPALANRSLPEAELMPQLRAVPFSDDDAESYDPTRVIEEFMDVEFYRAQVGFAGMNSRDAARHYYNDGGRHGLDPHPNFSTTAYLLSHPDVAEAGVNAFYHFLTRGEEEQRQSEPSALSFDNFGDGTSEWRHYEQVKRLGRMAGVPGKPCMELLDFACTLAGLDLAAEVNRLRLSRPVGTAAKNDLVSIVIPCWEEASVTAECLKSIFDCSGEANIEIVLVNNGSKDEFFRRIADHPDIKQINLPENIGFGPACNLGVAESRGVFVCFLNNDAQVAPGAITNLLAAMVDDPKLGMAGPKILSFDGRLQEAGTLITTSGTGKFIGFACNPNEPRFSYARDVEHLSAAATIVRRALFDEVGGFDQIYAPAYCEDADLSLKIRAAGFRLRYIPEALVAHHLSKTGDAKSDRSSDLRKKNLISRNRATLIRRWADTLNTFDIRTIAFYLPQYHPIPENDLWWGKGFTEWRNLTKAQPNFVGHRQPRRPADLGYYDLRVAEVMEEQAALARHYGVSAFCYYYYRFGDKRLLEMPLERMLETGRPDFPFCLCWANENWSRRWDGNDQDLLLDQKYGEDDAVQFASDIARYFRSKNYVAIDGKPLILFYRLQEVPNPKRYVAVCRNVWKTAGFADVVVAMVESFELSASPRHPAEFGADITVEFPAHGMVHDAPQRVRRTNADWIGNAHDYRELCRAFMTREEAGFKRLRSVLVGWDTTPRHPTRSLVLRNSTPGAFQAWLEWTYQRTREQNFGDERIVFVNAWNEWCEGSYLEPDADFGHGYLQAVKNAQESAVFGGTSFVEAG